MAGNPKRASMREGPLAALFRKTEEDGLHGEEHVPAMHSVLMQSAPLAQRWRMSHLRAHEPPQSLSDSLPFTLPSLQLVAWQLPLTHMPD